jgi:tight adherence protein C
MDFLPIAASGLLGGALFVIAWLVATMLASDDQEQGAEWRYDVSRINELRKADRLYRLFQPLVQLMARFNRNAFRPALPAVARELQAAGLPRFWLPEEYLARCELVALFCLPMYVYVCLEFMDLPGLVMAFVLTALTAWLLRRRLASLAKRRLQLIKRRMPFLLDLLTLLMEAGSTFLQALKQSVDELQGHPAATEFGRVLADINMGKARTQALTSLKERLADDEITGIVGAIVQSEDLGTPLARIFRTQADVLRIKRTQRAETIAGEAGVNMLLPGILVMMSTVLIIFGPFVLNLVYSGLSF